MAAGATVDYEDFEPYCRWRREQGCDTLEVKLEGFRKDQMKIVLSNAGVMSISGARPLDETNTKRSRFRKEIRLSKDYKNNEIHAKLSSGVLCIIMPKKSPTTTSSFQEQPTLAPLQNQGKERNSGPKTNLDTIASDEDKELDSENTKLLANKLSSCGRFQLRDIVTNRKKGEIVAVAIILGAFALYKYCQPSHVGG